MGHRAGRRNLEMCSGPTQGLMDARPGRREQGPSGPWIERLNGAAFRLGPHGPFAGSALQMRRHGVQWGKRGGAEGMGLRRRGKPSAYGILLDVLHTVHELRFGHDMALVEAAHPHICLALEAERETAFDELHGLFKRHIGRGRDQSVEMVGHDDECVQQEPSLAAIVKDGLQE